MERCFICNRPMKHTEKMVVEIFEDHFAAKGKEIYIHETCYDFAFSNPKGRIEMCEDCLRIIVEAKKLKGLSLCKHCMAVRENGEPKGYPPEEPPF